MAWEPRLWSSCILPLPCCQSSPPVCFCLLHYLSQPTHVVSVTQDYTHSHPLIHQIFIECPPSAQHLGYTDEFNTHPVLGERIVRFFSVSITAWGKGSRVASIGKINKCWGGRGTGIFLALLWLNVVSTSLSLTLMLVTGCRKVICAGEWHHFFLFLKKEIYASLPNSKILWLYDSKLI